MKPRRERGRRPWFSMALTVIALASVITLFNSGALNAGHGSFGLYLTDLASRVFSGPADAEISPPTTVTLRDSGRIEGLSLAGYPSYASTKIPLLRDTPLDDMRFVIRGTQDVATDAVAALRVTVNSERVLERVLSPGVRDFEWIVSLPRSLAEAGDLDVGFQLHGDLPDELCHNERSIGAVVAISPDTAVEMEARAPIQSLRDVVKLLPAQLTIAMPENPAGSSGDFFPMAMHLGARLTQRGYTVDYTYLDTIGRGRPYGRGLILLGSQEELRAAGLVAVHEVAGRRSTTLWRDNGYVRVGLTNPADREAVNFLTSDILPIARTAYAAPDVFVEAPRQAGLTRLSDVGADMSVQNVAEMRNWDIKYDLASLPGGHSPSQMRLEIRLPEGPGDFTNLVHTQLNGELIDSRHMQTGRLNDFTLDLPQQIQTLHNDIRVSVQRHRAEGGCAITARRYPVQMLPGSALVYNPDTPPLSGLAGLPQVFRHSVDIRVPGAMGREDRLEILKLGAQTVASFVPEQATISLHYVDPERPETTQAARPFVAFNHTPSNAAAPLDVQGHAVTLRNAAGVEAATIDNVERVAVMQVARAAVASPTRQDPDRIIQVPGLVAHALDEPPQISGAPIGQEEAVLVHGVGAVLALD